MGDGTFDRRAASRLYKQELPGPVDLLNVLSFASRRSYSAYMLAFAPTLLLGGGRIRLSVEHEDALIGPPWGDELLVIRYPSHRQFFRATGVPWYPLLNPLRERGVRAFELGLTRQDGGDGRLTGRILGIHFTPREGLEDELRRILGELGAEIAYSSVPLAPLILYRDPGPTDPEPPRFDRTILARVGATPAGDLREALRSLGEEGLVAQLYLARSAPEVMAGAVRRAILG